MSRFYPLSSLLNDIVTQNPSVPHARIEGFISQLLENEYLLSELRPPLANTDMLDYLITILSKIEEIEEAAHYITKSASHLIT